MVYLQIEWERKGKTIVVRKVSQTIIIGSVFASGDEAGGGGVCVIMYSRESMFRNRDISVRIRIRILEYVYLI
jgi:hypothetical protein